MSPTPLVKNGRGRVWSALEHRHGGFPSGHAERQIRIGGEHGASAGNRAWFQGVSLQSTLQDMGMVGVGHKIQSHPGTCCVRARAGE